MTLALIRDLFFRSKIDAIASTLGVEVEYASSLDALPARCAALRPSTVLADLSDAAFPPADTIRVVRAAAPDARVIGFASHVDLKAFKAARDAGFTQTLSRSEFTTRLPELLKP